MIFKAVLFQWRDVEGRMETKQSNLVQLMGSQSAHGATHEAALPKPFSPHLIAPLDPTPHVQQVQVTEEQVK